MLQKGSRKKYLREEGISPPDAVTENGVVLAPCEKRNDGNRGAAQMRRPAKSKVYHSTNTIPNLAQNHRFCAKEGEQGILKTTQCVVLPCEVNEGICPPDVVTENGVSLAPFETRNKAKLQGNVRLQAFPQNGICADNGTSVPESHYHQHFPLVGLEATEKLKKCLILVYFCPILPNFQRKIKSCAKRVPKRTTSDSDLN